MGRPHNATGFDKRLGTSKREQGIITPPAPRRHHCGCWYRGTQLWQMCMSHQQGLAAIVNQLQEMAKNRPATPAAPAADALKDAITAQEKPAGSAWHDDTKATDDVSVGIVTPNDGNTH